MSSSNGLGFYNIRGPLLDQDPIVYELTRYSLSSEPQFTLTFDCLDEPSAFDGEVRPCPTLP